MSSKGTGLSHRHAAVLHTDPFTQLLLLYLDVKSIEAFVVFLGKRFGCAACWVFQDDLLWSQLLQVYFAITPKVFNSGSTSITSPLSFAGRETKCTTLSASKPHTNHHHLPVPDAHPDTMISSALLQFVVWSRERRWFDQHVVIIRGDPACMDPVSSSDPFDEVYSDVYLRKRGGRAMSGDFADLEPPEVRSVHPLPRGSRNTFVIRGRSTQMRSLIHFVSPSSFLQSPWKKLGRTFGSAMEAIQSERLRNVAVLAPCPRVSSADKFALVGLREIQRFIQREAWSGTVGVVCYEKETFQAFKRQKEALLASFGAAMDYDSEL